MILLPACKGLWRKKNWNGKNWSLQKPGSGVHLKIHCNNLSGNYLSAIRSMWCWVLWDQMMDLRLACKRSALTSRLYNLHMGMHNYRKTGKGSTAFFRMSIHTCFINYGQRDSPMFPEPTKIVFGGNAFTKGSGCTVHWIQNGYRWTMNYQLLQKGPWKN